jgi:hypothetical protein
MTIIYMADLSDESSETRTFLEESGFDVMFGSNSLEAYEINAEFGDVVILFEEPFRTVAEELQAKFQTIEMNDESDPEELLEALNQAAQNLSTRKSIQ